MKQQLVLPMAFYVFYIFGLLLLNVRVRKTAIKSGRMDVRYFKTYRGDGAPDEVIVMGRHYDNQFQLPMLFLITCITYLAMDAVTSLTLILAWAFVVSRLVHSAVHLGRNHILKRMTAFGAGWVVLAVLWLELVFKSFAS